MLRCTPQFISYVVVLILRPYSLTGAGALNITRTAFAATKNPLIVPNVSYKSERDR